MVGNETWEDLKDMWQTDSSDDLEHQSVAQPETRWYDFCPDAYIGREWKV